MRDPDFFPIAETPTVAAVADWVGGQIAHGRVADSVITGVAPLDLAQAGDLSFLDNPKYRPAFDATRAGACLVGPKFADVDKPDTICVVVGDPYRAYGTILQRLYPTALTNPFYTLFETGGRGRHVHPEARLEEGVTVEPGAVIGPGAFLGSGSIIGAGSAVGANVRIGRDCAIGPNVAVQAAMIGDRVIIHSGAAIGQDGFGFAMGLSGHLKVPQIGRVVIQNDVEIGANTTIDRGANRDTVIGEGSKIDNLCQIAHNVEIGRHCIIVAQTGISGSARLGDFVALGGQVGVVGHVTIGDGAQIAATSNVNDDVPAGARWGGTPAKPVRQWFREVATLRRLAEGK